MQISARFIVGVISFGIALTGATLGNMFIIMMIGEINRKKEEGHLISYFGYPPWKTFQVCHEYRRLYPNGKILAYEIVSVVIMLIGFIGVCICVFLLGWLEHVGIL